MSGKARPPRPSTPLAQLRLLADAMSSVANAIFITDGAGRIIWVNEAFGRLSGYSAAEAIGRTPSFLKSGVQGASFYRELWQTILAGEVWRGEVTERRKDGVLYTVDEVITPLRDDRGAVTHFIVIQNDITRRKQEGDQEHFLAYHDPLTGLPNRLLFLSALRHAIGQARSARRSVVLLFLDLDGFKPINDSLGHAIGDRLLVAVAERLSAAVRRTDMVARLGGDEFAILQTGLRDPDADEVARKLLHTVAQPFVFDGQMVSVTASIGIAIYPLDDEAPHELLNKADKAMYRAKSRGRNRYELYTQR